MASGCNFLVSKEKKCKNISNKRTTDVTVIGWSGCIVMLELSEDFVNAVFFQLLPLPLTQFAD